MYVSSIFLKLILLIQKNMWGVRLKIFNFFYYSKEYHSQDSDINSRSRP